MSDTWAQLATLALALVCFESGERFARQRIRRRLRRWPCVLDDGADGRIAILPTQVSDAAGQLLELMGVRDVRRLCAVHRLAGCPAGG